MKYFNVAGPCIEGWHYMLNATERLHNQLTELINTQQYFVIHAARQTGKTTLLINLANKINKEGKYYVVYCSLERLDGVVEPEIGIKGLLSSFQMALENYGFPNPETFGENIDKSDYTTAFGRAIRNYCAKLDKPLVIFFDEADCLVEKTLISFLRQLRDGFINRSIASFPMSVALVGMRNLRDYRARIRADKETLGTASPFNIITSSLTLRNFTKEEVSTLYRQHTDETGQIFEDAAIELIFEQTQGQPWLVNAIAREVIVEQLKKDFSQPITAGMAEEAIKTIILRRDVHIDQLKDKLTDPRIRKTIEPMILGEENSMDRNSDDFEYVKDLGLIRVEREGIMPANPIYGEVIVRTLNYNEQMSLTAKNEYEMPKYYKNDRIDMNLLLQDFQSFWRENSAIWVERFQYKEAAPHLILMAFLQRVINGGGNVTRELASERGRLDLCVHYKEKRYPIEIKIFRGQKTIEQGIEQTFQYMNSLNCTDGWLVVFDRNQEKPWDEKIYQKTEELDRKMIHIFGC